MIITNEIRDPMEDEYQKNWLDEYMKDEPVPDVDEEWEEYLEYEEYMAEKQMLDRMQ